MMTLLRGLGPPGESEMFAGNHRHATWDAAYLLGALCAADRREFEGHMADCPSCRYAVAELSGTPALLSQLDRNCVAAISETDHTSGAPEMSPELLPSSLATVRWRRRRTRLMTWMAAAAAAIVLTIGVLVGVAGRSPTSPPPQATVSTQQMALAMVVVGRDSSQTRLTTWVAIPGHSATPTGSISTPVNQIAAVQVVLADSGQVTLERSL
jgi:Putative zinc-finger